MGKKAITAKDKSEAINLVLESNMSMKEVAKKKGIGYSTLSKIIKDFKENDNTIDMDESSSLENSSLENSNITPKLAEIQSLKNKIKQLQKEKQTLKDTISILMSDS